MKKIILIAADVLSVLLVLFITVLLLKYFLPSGSWINQVEGDSMWPTLHDSQIVFSEKLDNVTRGDVVIANIPKTVIENNYEYQGGVLIKRVIGVPGDEIRITQDGIFVNQELLMEDYVTEENKGYTYKENGYMELTLEADEYFLVGDNRKVSMDSRRFGPVKAEDMLYKQLETPTRNFYIKIVILVLLFIVAAGMYLGFEIIMKKWVKRYDNH
ncbi:MAG: signal peptidase I [Tyzzerella sp.]|nr:signal peptidase I [Tyzzerella sp.]